ncbi:hypothetical protein OnM2_023007 [Erysiphe neolycopersici]|uniref:Uncharacterized protein n=1 Tax=Erysiphe neolycopersici TaxID=212602 RepID=A0A420I218_9PEZI|nr:hypothetical protein OnM2_023007 [Erysiphe neolycopersici]
MSFLGGLLNSLISIARRGDDETDDVESEISYNGAGEAAEQIMKESFQPAVGDVLAAKASLLNKLPIEIVDTIIDFAEYWPHTHIGVKQNSAIDSYRITAGINEDEFLLRSYPLGYIPKENDPTDLSFQTHSFATNPPLPGYDCTGYSQGCTKKTLQLWAEESKMRGEFPCRKIVFTLQSHDQGWGGIAGCRGTYRNSFTWFDIGKEEACMFEKSSPGQAESSNTEVPEIRNTTLHMPYFSPSLAIHVESSQGIDVICTTRTISPTTSSSISTSHLEVCGFNHPLLPDSNVLQKNVAAVIENTKHVITWSYDDHIDPESTAGDELENMGRGRATGNGEYVRSLKCGQIVTVWGKSRFRNWINHVEEVTIDIYWAV